MNSVIPFYGAENPDLFKIERASMDRDGVVINYLDHLLPAGRVLDIGAGNGFTAELLNTDNRRVVAYEPSLGMIGLNRSLTWVSGVAQNLAFGSGVFEAVYATWAYFFPASGYGQEGLEEARRVVKTGGPIVVVDNAGDDEFCGLFERDISSDAGWWDANGFECHILNTSFVFESLDDANELLSLYWHYNGRRQGREAKLEIEYKVAVYVGM